MIINNSSYDNLLYCKIILGTKGNGRSERDNDTVEAFKYGQMVQSIKDFGRMIKLKGGVGLFTAMETYTKDNGKMIKQMVEEFIFISQVQHIKVTG